MFAQKNWYKNKVAKYRMIIYNFVI